MAGASWPTDALRGNRSGVLSEFARDAYSTSGIDPFTGGPNDAKQTKQSYSTDNNWFSSTDNKRSTDNQWSSTWPSGDNKWSSGDNKWSDSKSFGPNDGGFGGKVDSGSAFASSFQSANQASGFSDKTVGVGFGTGSVAYEPTRVRLTTNGRTSYLDHHHIGFMAGMEGKSPDELRFEDSYPTQAKHFRNAVNAIDQNRTAIDQQRQRSLFGLTTDPTPTQTPHPSAFTPIVPISPTSNPFAQPNPPAGPHSQFNTTSNQFTSNQFNPNQFNTDQFNPSNQPSTYQPSSSFGSSFNPFANSDHGANVGGGGGYSAQDTYPSQTPFGQQPPLAQPSLTQTQPLFAQPLFGQPQRSYPDSIGANHTQTVSLTNPFGDSVFVPNNNSGSGQGSFPRVSQSLFNDPFPPTNYPPQPPPQSQPQPHSQPWSTTQTSLVNNSRASTTQWTTNSSAFPNPVLPNAAMPSNAFAPSNGFAPSTSNSSVTPLTNGFIPSADAGGGVGVVGGINPFRVPPPGPPPTFNGRNQPFPAANHPQPPILRCGGNIPLGINTGAYFNGNVGQIPRADATTDGGGRVKTVGVGVGEVNRIGASSVVALDDFSRLNFPTTTTTTTDIGVRKKCDIFLGPRYGGNVYISRPIRPPKSKGVIRGGIVGLTPRTDIWRALGATVRHPTRCTLSNRVLQSDTISEIALPVKSFTSEDPPTQPPRPITKPLTKPNDCVAQSNESTKSTEMDGYDVEKYDDEKYDKDDIIENIEVEKFDSDKIGDGDGEIVVHDNPELQTKIVRSKSPLTALADITQSDFEPIATRIVTLQNIQPINAPTNINSPPKSNNSGKEPPKSNIEKEESSTTNINSPPKSNNIGKEPRKSNTIGKEPRKSNIAKEESSTIDVKEQMTDLMEYYHESSRETCDDAKKKAGHESGNIDLKHNTTLGSGVMAPRLLDNSELTTFPLISKLSTMTEDELKFVVNFSIIHKTYGSIVWLEPTDVRGINIDKIVLFEQGVCEVRLDRRRDIGLNKPAKITLFNCFPSKNGKRLTDYNNPHHKHLFDKHKINLRNLCFLKNAKFLDYSPLSGSWSFIVHSFLNPNPHSQQH